MWLKINLYSNARLEKRLELGLKPKGFVFQPSLISDEMIRVDLTCGEDPNPYHSSEWEGGDFRWVVVAWIRNQRIAKFVDYEGSHYWGLLVKLW
jgi:hypothetical protein